MRRLSWALVLLLLGAGIAAAADFDHALEVYDRGDYDLAFIEFSDLAEEGHAKSQFNLGLMYFRGLGTPPNPGQSIYWALKSANQGYALAQYTVGAMYSSGQGLGRDADEAAKWFRRAADQNHAQAQHDLGSLYGEGRGVPRDAVIGRMWYLLAIPGLKGEAKSYAKENLSTLERRMTADETELSDQLAADWKPS